MPQPILVLRVVVASPGDVKAERDALIDVFAEVNRDTAHPARLHLEMTRWEDDARPGFYKGGPQSGIDPILNIPECDLFIGLLWSRLGSPTIAGDTGTEREFNTAYKAWNDHRRPEILAYFCTRQKEPASDEDRDQVTRVETFKKAFPREGFAWKYDTVDDFKTLVARHLRTFLREQIQALWSKDTAAVRQMLEARSAQPPTVAVLGRISTVERHDKAMDACEESMLLLGDALADVGYRIMVYDVVATMRV